MSSLTPNTQGLNGEVRQAFLRVAESDCSQQSKVLVGIPVLDIELPSVECYRLGENHQFFFLLYKYGVVAIGPSLHRFSLFDNLGRKIFRENYQSYSFGRMWGC